MTIKKDFAIDHTSLTSEASHTLEMDDSQLGITQKKNNQVDPRTESLARAQRELCELCSPTGSRTRLEDFLATWNDPQQPDRVQPNALAWSEAAEPLATAIRNNCEDLLPKLLAYGMRSARSDLWAALEILESKWSRTATRSASEGRMGDR